MVAPNTTGSWTEAGGGFGDATLSYPTGDVADEIFLIYVIAFAYGTLGTFTVSGFTELGTHTWTGPNDGSEWRISWFGRIRDGTEGANVTVEQSTSMYMNCGMTRVADVDVSGTITDALDVTPTVTGNGRTTSATMVQTTTVTDDATYFCHGTPYDHTWSGDPSGFTQEVSDGNAQRVWSKEMATAGATGTPSISLSNTDDYMLHGIALKPASSGDATVTPATVAASAAVPAPTVTGDEAAAIELVGTAYVRDGNGPNVSVDMSSLDTGSIAADDFAVFSVIKDQDDGTSITQTAGDTCTVLHQDQSTAGRDRTVAVFYRVLDGTETTMTFADSGDTVEEISVAVTVWRGVDTTTPLDVTFVAGDHYSEGQNNYNGTPDPITTANDDAVVLILQTITHDDITTAGAPSGYTIALDGTGTTLDNAQQVHVYKLVETAGTETPGAFTHTVNATIAEANFWTLALRLGSDGDATVTASTVAATAAVPAPTVTAESNATVTASTVAVAGSVPVASVSTSTNATVTPSTVAAVVAAPAATVSAQSNATVSPATAAATATVPAPTVAAASSATVTASTVTATATVPAVTVETAGNATVTPATVNATAAVGAVTVAAESNATITPATVAAVATVPAVTVQTAGNATVAASTVDAVTAVGTVTVDTESNATAAPSTVAATASVPTPTVTAVSNATISATTVAAVAAVPAAAVQTAGNATVAATTIAAVATVPAPTVSSEAGATVAPATVAGVADVGSVTVMSSVSIGATTIAAVVTVEAVDLSTGSTITVATVNAVAGVGSIGFSSSTTVAAATVAALTGVDSVTLTSSSTVTPATVAGVVVVPLPTVASFIISDGSMTTYSVVGVDERTRVTDVEHRTKVVAVHHRTEVIT